jgi:CDAN1-interacting nuclease 1
MLQAMFGDVQTHHASVLPQAEAFVHRFGPGLILYWFGHAPPERLADAKGDVIVSSWELPSKFMLPTGEVLRRSA